MHIHKLWIFNEWKSVCHFKNFLFFSKSCFSKHKLITPAGLGFNFEDYQLISASSFAVKYFLMKDILMKIYEIIFWCIVFSKGVLKYIMLTLRCLCFNVVLQHKSVKSSIKLHRMQVLYSIMCSVVKLKIHETKLNKFIYVFLSLKWNFYRVIQ